MAKAKIFFLFMTNSYTEEKKKWNSSEKSFTAKWMLISIKDITETNWEDWLTDSFPSCWCQLIFSATFFNTDFKIA